MAKIKLEELVLYCKSHRFQKEFVIIPNCSGEYKHLTNALDKEKIYYALDNSKEPKTSIDGCYFFDFREIDLIF